MSRTAIESAVRSGRQFNVIRTFSSRKADCILPATPFDQVELSRGVVNNVRADLKAVFAAPEDVIFEEAGVFSAWRVWQAHPRHGGLNE